MVTKWTEQAECPMCQGLGCVRRLRLRYRWITWLIFPLFALLGYLISGGMR